MGNYLLQMDKDKSEFIKKNNSNEEVYLNKELYFYQPIIFDLDKIKFSNGFYAVKIKKTTIILHDQINNIKVHFSDKDVNFIIKKTKVNQKKFYDYLEKNILNLISNKDLNEIKFTLGKTQFKFWGIAFSEEFNSVQCQNPADIQLNGNDLIGLLNLIAEKERTDTNKEKLKNTFEYYIRS